MGQSKEFDRSVCFSYFGNYLQQIELIEETCGIEMAHKANMAIIRYGLLAEDITDPYIKMLVGAPTLSLIDSSQSRRERGFTGEDLEKTKLVTDYYRDHPNASQNEIAKATGVSKGKVNKVMKKIREKGLPSDSSINIDSDIDNDTDSSDRDRDRSTDHSKELADAQTDASLDSEAHCSFKSKKYNDFEIEKYMIAEYKNIKESSFLDNKEIGKYLYDMFINRYECENKNAVYSTIGRLLKTNGRL